METREEIITLVGQYLKKFSNEKEQVQPVSKFLQQFSGQDLIDRKNFIGHLTTSAFIIDKSAKRLLLLKHKSLNRWLQPGGHIEQSDPSLISSALREAIEETGITANYLTPLSSSIFDINSHNIPANQKKLEPLHVHHDIRYLFKCTNPDLLNISLEESTDSRWLPISELQANEDFRWFNQKLQVFL